MTKMTDNQLDQLFKEKASGHTMNPSIETWQIIAAKTAVKQAAMLKKSGLLWKWLSIGLTATLVSTVAVYEWLDYNKEQQLAEITQTQQPLTVAEIQTPIVDEESISIAEPVSSESKQAVIATEEQIGEKHQVKESKRTEASENAAFVSNISDEKKIANQQQIQEQPYINKTLPSTAIAKKETTAPLLSEIASDEKHVIAKSAKTSIIDKKEPEIVNDVKLPPQKTIAAHKVAVTEPVTEVTVDPSFPNNIKSIEAEQQTKLGSRFFVSATSNYGFSHRMLAMMRGKSHYSTVYESPGAAFGGGLLLGMELSDRWELRIGAVWQRLSQNIKISYMDIDSKEPELAYVNTAAGSVLVPAISKDMSLIGKQNFSYIRVPLLADCNFGSKKTRVAFTFGPAMNFLLQHEMKLDIKKGSDTYTVSDIKGLRNKYLDFSAGFMVKRDIAKRWELTAGPVLRCAVIPATEKGWNAKYRPYSAVLNLGMTCHF